MKSPSNTNAELHDKSMTAIAGGAEECWVADWVSDYEKRTLTVYNHRRGMHIYRANEAVPVPMFSGRILLEQIIWNI